MRTEIAHLREALASYIEATYHLSNPKVVDLRRKLLTRGGIAQIPYIESTPTYIGTRKFDSLTLPAAVKDFLKSLASDQIVFDPPYEHQAQTLEETVKESAGGKGFVITTGTGSGKTEAFLLPVLARLADEAAHRPEHFSSRAVRALLLYPMNALVNDQLGRLRSLFGNSAVTTWFHHAAGRPAKFGRYTGRTLYPGVRNGGRDQTRLKTLEYYLKIEDEARAGAKSAQDLIKTLRDRGRWPAKPDSFVGAFDGLRKWYGKPGQHWEDAAGNPGRANELEGDPELLTRHEIQNACPDLLITNYSMLEYMLLRPIERQIFANTREFFELHPNEKFFLILDEAHLYRGANGTEVAYLIRRLLDRLGLPPSRVVFIATSASFSNALAAKDFVAGLMGLEPGSITTLTGEKRAFEPAGPGSAQLAQAFEAVPVSALQSTSPKSRATVIEPIAKAAPKVGFPVTIRRNDGGSGEILVTVTGLSGTGDSIEEVLVVPAKGLCSTQHSFLVVQDVLCPDGSVSVSRRYELGTCDAEGFASSADDLPSALEELLAGLPVIGRLRNLTSGAKSNSDLIDSKGAAWALSDLPSALFPDSDPVLAGVAVDALLELASLANATPASPPLLPARVHMLFRGLPGLWACVNPQCSEIGPEERGGPTGALYAEPRQNCECGSHIYELHSCRACGLSVALANIGSPAGVEHLWQENGRAYVGETGLIEAIHVCLENPMPQQHDAVRPAYLDVATGRIDGLGKAAREVWLPPLTAPTKTFEHCPRCGAESGPNSNSGISDLQTKGEQPFQELISVQVLEQPPRPEIKTALQGRKALIFSDGRQTASRLAGTLKTFSFRDSLRPLLLAGMTALRDSQFKPSLDDAPVAIALAAAKHEVRLRAAGDEDGRMNSAGEQMLELTNDDDAEDQDFRALSSMTSERTPRSVFESIYSVLQDDHTGLSPLALAVLRPKLTKSDQKKLTDGLKLPIVEGLNPDQVRTSLIELWLWQAMRKRAIKIQYTDQAIVGARGSASLHEWNGQFSKNIGVLLEARGLKQWLSRDFVNICEPALRAVFAPGATGNYFVQAGKVSLDIAKKEEWIRCERCTSVSPRNALLGDRCGYCTGVAKPISPSKDPVFRSRKAFYRRLWERLSDAEDNYVPHQLIAEEHSAALNDSGMANAMSRNEAYELRFQDVPIKQEDGRVLSPIDILSCTTTMEVGIDIGGLTAVALRNVPPGRANYQQRAGRAGRRGAGLSTVIMFCGADSHDQSFFRDPAPIVAGPAPDPILNLDNLVITRRQAFAYLIGRFQQDRISTVAASSNVFSSLGSVADFLNGADDLFSLSGLKEWISTNKEELAANLNQIFASSCSGLKASDILDQFPDLLETHLKKDIEGESKQTTTAVTAVTAGDDEVQEDAADSDNALGDSGNLLDRLFAEGLLPKYAFPTDVATFSVFESDADPWDPKRRYSPQQSLNAALSQYAPGREVWVDGQRYVSLGIYAERHEDRISAYRDRRLYFQCRICNYADLLERDEGYVEQTRDCPACGGPATLGPSRLWVRPPGFSHPPNLAPLPPGFELPTHLHPTKATLDSLKFENSSRIGGENWPLGTGWEGWSESKNLVVTNRGSLNATQPGFRYCTQCGRIEPADFDSEMQQLRNGQPHNRPRPNRPNEPDLCSGTVTRIVLGNEFRTDVSVFRLALPAPWHFHPEGPSTTIAARSAVEALLRAACMLEDLEPNDIEGHFRFAPHDGVHQFIDLYLYDQASGGAGFVRAATHDPQRLVDAALTLLEDCTCDDSCYQCLRSYKNRFEHALFDRRIGADLLRACFKGKQLDIEPSREDYALDRLKRDLEESGASMERVEGGLIGSDGKVVCLAHPFRPNEPCSERAKTLAHGKDAIAVDILLVLRALPIACSAARSEATGELNDGLLLDPNGIPELTPEMVIAGELTPGGNALRYAVADAQTGDILFRLTANTLSGKNADGAGGEVSNGTMCLFRPFSGQPTKTGIYLIRRTDGHAFGATGKAWTVGILQPVGDAGIRVRYRAASQCMECVSELVQPADAVVPIATFVKAVI